MFNNKNKSGQEEMVGFAIIIVLVSVILLVFLGLSLNQSPKEIVSSYEVDGFLQGFLQYTTSCDDNYGYLSIQKVIFECSDKNKCLNGEDPCEILNNTLKGILDESWPIYEENSVYKGYSLDIWKEGDDSKTFTSNKGNITKSYKWSSQELPKKRDMFYIEFKAYF